MHMYLLSVCSDIYQTWAFLYMECYRFQIHVPALVKICSHIWLMELTLLTICWQLLIIIDQARLLPGHLHRIRPKNTPPAQSWRAGTGSPNSSHCMMTSITDIGLINALIRWDRINCLLIMGKNVEAHPSSSPKLISPLWSLWWSFSP